MTQAHAHFMNMTGRDDNFINENIWKPHNIHTGNRMYNLCSDLRGFYVKVFFMINSTFKYNMEYK